MTIQKVAIHQKTLNIEWGDMDALGHVNNGRYLDYFQQARIELLESIELSMNQHSGPVVVQVACTFLKPIVYPAQLTLTSSLHSLGRTSFIIDHELYQDGTLMTQGMGKIVWVDYQKNKAIPIPKCITQLFEAHGISRYAKNGN